MSSLSSSSFLVAGDDLGAAGAAEGDRKDSGWVAGGAVGAVEGDRKSAGFDGDVGATGAGNDGEEAGAATGAVGDKLGEYEGDSL